MDNVLQWFGLVSTAIALLFVFSGSKGQRSDVVNMVMGLFLVVGFPCAVCGLFRYDPARPFYKMFYIGKYTGLLCLISALLFLSFQGDALAQTYTASAFAWAGFGALAVSVFCVVLGTRVRSP